MQQPVALILGTRLKSFVCVVARSFEQRGNARRIVGMLVNCLITRPLLLLLRSPFESLRVSVCVVGCLCCVLKAEE